MEIQRVFQQNVDNVDSTVPHFNNDQIRLNGMSLASDIHHYFLGVIQNNPHQPL